MAFQNYETPYMRQRIALWLAGTTLYEFTVSDIMQGVDIPADSVQTVDLCKAVSNELIRLETQHRLLSRKGVKGVDGCGVGRPPRVYHKRRPGEPVRKKEKKVEEKG